MHDIETPAIELALNAGVDGWDEPPAADDAALTWAPPVVVPTAAIINFKPRPARQSPSEDAASQLDVADSLSLIESRLSELARLINRAGDGTDIPPVLLDGILRAVAALQQSMRAYQASAPDDPDPAA